MNRGLALAVLLALVTGCPSNRHVIPTPGPHGAGPTLTPPANVFLRTGMDDDPSSYLGRFVPDNATAADVDEAAALQLPCSRYYRIKKVGGGGIEYDELFRASRAASVQFGIPKTPVAVGASSGEESVVRIKYKLLHKWIAELSDPAGFETCCKQASDQCTGRVVGEFLGGTGSVWYAEGSEANVGVDAPGIGSLEVKDGVVWRRGIAFEQPVFFAFKLTGSTVQPQGVAAGDDWDRVVPRSTQGTYFVGTSDYLESERVARDEALLDARRQVVRWLGEAIEQGSVRVESLSGRAGKLQAALSDEGAVRRASSAVVRFLKDEQWKSERASMPDGMRYQAKVLAFLPKASVEGAAEAALDALGEGTR